MKFILKRDSQYELETYCKGPVGSWESFRNSDAYQAVVKALWEDQRGICAYCEVDLIRTDGTGYSDVRVEHFHPKDDNHPVWTFNWENLLLTCCGGNRDHIHDDQDRRFTSPDHSCDVPKGNHVLDGVILHPAQEPMLKGMLFTYSDDGSMAVSDNCDSTLTQLASKTIEHLRLSPTSMPKRLRGQQARLIRMRAAFLAGMRDEIEVLLRQGHSIEESMQILAASAYPEETEKTWIKFFSCARWYLGDAAEKRLAEIGYLH